MIRARTPPCCSPFPMSENRKLPPASRSGLFGRSYKRHATRDKKSIVSRLANWDKKVWW